MKCILKTSFLITIILVLGFEKINAQTYEPISAKNISVKSNGVIDFSISIDVAVDINSDEGINTDFWIDKSNKPKFHVTYAGKSNPKECQLLVNATISKSGFGFKITGFNTTSINQFLAKDNQISIAVDDDIKIQLLKADGKTLSRNCMVKKQDINKMISENLSIKDDQRATYISYLNNFYYYENNLDFGIKPSKDTSATSYFITFHIENRYNFKKLLKCDSVKKNLPHLFWSLEGRISTDFSDSLNYINYYPVNLQFSNYTSSVPYELNFKFGNESNQTFSNKRIVVDGAYTLIIPNLVNLTTEAADRIRFKPIITTGIKGYYDYSNHAPHFASGQAYISFHYYIPVFNNYALIIDENPFYDFSKEKNPNHKIGNQYSIILGAEVPKTGFKAIFKYVNGKSNINFKQGEIIGIGLLMDFFQEKDKPQKLQ